MTAYGSTKWAVRGMSRTMVAELALEIRVNTICPGFIATPMLDANTAEFNEAGYSATPMKRAGRPEEVSDLVLFLASPKSSYITGAEIAIDGDISD